MGEVIVVTAGKGGVGKTTTTANISYGLAKLGKKVVAIDMDFGLRNLDLVMGLADRVVYNIMDAISGKMEIKDILVKHPEMDNLFMIAAPQTKDKTAVTEEEMKTFCDTIKNDFDYVIMDAPAGIEMGFKNASAGATRAIIVTTPDDFSVRDADRICHLLFDKGIKQQDLIINRLRPKMVKEGLMISPEDITEIVTAPLIGVIPDEEWILASNHVGKSAIGSDKLVGTLYLDICKRIVGENVEFKALEIIEEIPKQKKGFLSLFKKKQKN